MLAVDQVGRWLALLAALVIHKVQEDDGKKYGDKHKKATNQILGMEFIHHALSVGCGKLFGRFVRFCLGLCSGLMECAAAGNIRRRMLSIE